MNTKDQINIDAIHFGIDRIDTLITDEQEVYGCDLHNEIYNMDYFVIYRQDAIDQLEAYGVFNAIEYVTDWMHQNLGEIDTQVLIDPVRLCNMLAYVIGYDIFDNLPTVQEHWDDKYLTVDQLKQIRKEMEALL